MSESTKCSFTKRGSWKPCSTISRCWSDGRGLSVRMMMDFAKGTSRDIPVLRSGEFVEHGIVLNFCPICGTSLKRLYKTGAKK
jgi:hypothetical protein